MGIKFAANLSTMFTELPFLERFDAAAGAGFTAVEYLFPYAHPAVELRAELTRHGLQQVLFNAPAGDWDAGERGMAALPGREEEFAESITTALAYAEELGCPRIHVMAGNTFADATTSACYVERIQVAADAAARAGRSVTIEPINSRDMPGYFLASMYQGVDLLDRIDRENVGLQFDIYHAQIMHGDLVTLIRSVIDRIAHVQIASVPDRCEPDHGEINYSYVLEQLAHAGYDGWVGCEYFPRASTTGGLDWLAPYRD